MKYFPLQKWNDALASMAQEWTDACVFKHGQPSRPSPPHGGVLGQNNFMKTISGTSDEAIEAWFNEKPDYNFDGNSCTSGKMCGHYTQVSF